MTATDHKRAKSSHATQFGSGAGTGFWVKLVLVALINAVGIYGIFLAIAATSTVLTVLTIAVLLLVNLVYFVPSAKLLPLKYLLPGLIFLLIYQVFVIGFTAYTAFTNYGDGHNSSKDAAVGAILREHEVRVPDSPTTPISVVQSGDEFGFAFVDQTGTVQVGMNDHPFQAADGATETDGKVTSVPDANVLSFAQISQNAQAVTAVRVPISDDPADGSMRTADGSRGFLAHPTMQYDDVADTLTNTITGEVYTANDHGNFETAAGQIINPGWNVNVGWENFTKVFTGGKLSTEFFGVLWWTVLMAFLSVVTTFALGLALAMLFDTQMRGKKLYRALLILPYAFPSFLSALVWAGMLNQEHGFINNTLLGGASIPWLLHPFWAKLSVIGVNLWLGFPYMLLISMGALQSIDSQVYEAAKIDGASPWRQTRSIVLPLLMISTAPLLISSFAFNFNNFNLIYMLTGGGPKDLTSVTGSGVGATDILVTYTYKIAFSGGLQQHGLASAISILIFIIVATISVIGFRQTRKLEEVV